MTKQPRLLVRDLDQDNKHERGLHCCVRHPDAGGRCQRTATMKMYEMLNFCPEHGEEARLGAELEAYQDAEYFFDRFRNPHVPDLTAVVERELSASITRMKREGPSDTDYERALLAAYPNPPEGVREIIRQWERDERADRGPTPLDLLLKSLNTILKLMRLTFEDGEDWLVEILEDQRQEMAARAAFALVLAEEPRPAE